MVGVEVSNYLNPITLEAELFVKSMESLTKSTPYIDKYVIQALERVVQCIEYFLDQKNQEIVATDKCNLLDASEFRCISTLYVCNKCKFQVGKSVNNATKHITHACCKYARQKETSKVPDNLQLSKKAKSLLIGDFTTFLAENLNIADKVKRTPEYDIIEADLLGAIKPSFPESPLRIYRFGSRISGIGSKDSDVDIFIDIGNTFKIFENRPSTRTLEKLQIVHTALRKKNNIWKNLVKIEKARVPILKVYHTASGLDCDIGFSNSLGVINTKLVEYLFDIQPIARNMCICLKKWLLRIKLNTEFNTYTIVLMVIFFLQTRNLIPAVEFLQSRVDFNKALYIGPWLGTFVACNMSELNLEKIDANGSNCKAFLSDFFEYYSKFDFKTYAVCPYLGKSTRICDLEKQMPNWYNFFAKSSPDDCKLNLDKPMVVQDPIQLNHNVAKGISQFNVNSIIQFMYLSIQILLN